MKGDNFLTAHREQSLLGCSPEVSLKDGPRAAVAWFEQELKWPQEIFLDRDAQLAS